MTEYIKREAAINAACTGCNREFPEKPCEPPDCYIRAEIQRIPAADVVEVVRCKDCIWFEHNVGCPIHRSGMFKKGKGLPWDNDFCSYGERKNNG